MTENKKEKKKKMKGVVAEANSDPKTLKEALIKVLEEQGIEVIRNK